MKLRLLLAIGTAAFIFTAVPAAAQTSTVVVVSSDPASPSVLGQSVSFAAMVFPPGSGGTVAFLDGGVAIGEAPVDADGVATFTTANLTTGSHSIVAQFLGQGGYLPGSSTALGFTVGKRPTTLSFGGSTPSLVGAGEVGVVTVTVADASTAGPPGAPGSFTALPAALAGPRTAHTATRLRSGLVLIIGGTDGSGRLLDAAHSVEVFDPVAGTFTPMAHGLLTPRRDNTATLLQDGTVLVAGGVDATGTTLNTAERYDPATGEFSAVAGRLQTARFSHAAVLLPDGTVLLIGGTPIGGDAVLRSIEAYKDGAFQVASGLLDTARLGASATLLADGQTILVAGGTGSSQSATPTVEFLRYAAATHTASLLGLGYWSNPYGHHTATLLPDGGVLFTGGWPTNGFSQAYAFIYHPPAVLSLPLRFTAARVTPGMTVARGGHAAALLDDGRVLLVGGVSGYHGTVGGAETFRPAFEPTGTPTLSSSDPTDTLFPCSLAFSGGGAAACGEETVPATIGPGSRTLTVSWTGDDNHLAPAPDTASVALSVEKGDPTLSWSPVSMVYGVTLGFSQLSASARTAMATLPGRFTYSPPFGTLLGAGAHTLSVTFTPTDTANFNPATMSVQLFVQKAAPQVQWATPMGIYYGTPLGSAELDAIATGIDGMLRLPGRFTYDPPAGTVLGAGSRHLSVTFDPSDSANYTSASAYTYLSVYAARTEITWAAPAVITYGTPLSAAQLDATAGTFRGAVPGTFTYSPAAGTVLPAGAAQVLTATFRPSDTIDYVAPSPITVTIDVARATPAIAWPDPPEITYGTALSDLQLDATATGVTGAEPLDGTFLYSPAAGAVLGAGAGQVLTVTFAPSDTSNYAPAGQQALVSVRKATPIVSWADPPPIVHGTPLGTEQLGAEFLWTVDGVGQRVSGTAVYDPPAGTVLPVGPAQPLTVHFVPDDVLDYDSPPDATVTIAVLSDLAITPASPSVTAGQGTSFTASGGSGAGFVWSLAANRSGGSITAQGVYTAGATAGVSDVVQVQDSQGNTATVEVAVEVAATPEGGGGGGCSSGGGAGTPIAAAGLLLALALRRRRA